VVESIDMSYGVNPDKHLGELGGFDLSHFRVEGTITARFDSTELFEEFLRQLEEPLYLEFEE